MKSRRPPSQAHGAPQAGPSAGARLDPRAVLLAALLSIAALLTSGNGGSGPSDWWTIGLCFIACGVVLVARAGASLAHTLRALWFVFILAAAAGWFDSGPITDSRSVAHHVTAALFQVARLAGLTAIGAWLFALAPPEDLAEGLRRWAGGLLPGVPLRYTFVVGAGIRFVPRMGTLFADLRAAQEARGLRFTPFWRHAGAYLGLMVPLLREILRLSDQLAQALEARGFSATPRTLPDLPGWRWREWLIVLAAVAMLILALTLGRS